MLMFFVLVLVCLTRTNHVWGCLTKVDFQHVENQQHEEKVEFYQSSGKPFGDVPKSQHLQVDVVSGYIKHEDFFRNYVIPSKPLLMRNAAKISPAFEKWKEDSYFVKKIESLNSTKLEQPVAEDELAFDDMLLTVEVKKKENRNLPPVEMTFLDFLKTYHETENYMVDSVPDFLQQDLIIPFILQCPIVLDNLANHVMWFSSGGTKSVVHTDEVENINCLYAGEKTFVLVDPSEHKNNVPIEVTDGAYSEVNVDDVDFSKYPGHKKAEYYHVNMSAGDCLYIPFLWIHQVRSYHRNIAVNLWWRYIPNLLTQLHYAKCRQSLELTLEKAVFHGLGHELDESTKLKNDLKIYLMEYSYFDEAALKEFLSPKYLRSILDKTSGYDNLIRNIFEELDQNSDQKIVLDEIESISHLRWRDVFEDYERLQSIYRTVEKRMGQSSSDNAHLTTDEL